MCESNPRKVNFFLRRFAGFYDKITCVSGDALLHFYADDYLQVVSTLP